LEKGLWLKDVACEATINAGYKNTAPHLLVKSKQAEILFTNGMFGGQIRASPI
jgi:hypothetical protein